jgi:hypothetical protein
MKKTYAGKRLLEHGQLTRAEFKEITGWPGKASDRVLQTLCEQRIAVKVNQPGEHRVFYSLVQA